MEKNFYITTAIDYANGKPHLGHAYEKVLSDVIARIERLKGSNVHFLTGLDEHGQKVQQTAQARGIEPQALCDEIAVSFQSLCQLLNISNDDYIRTTEQRHKSVVASLLTQLHEKGEIYQAEYQGYYSTRTEQFLHERDQVDGAWPSEYGEVVEVTERNYFFKLSNYQNWLLEYLESHPDFIYPEYRLKQVLEFLKEPLNDLCISRPKERLSWGIPLPFDEDYVSYVWFDALINYISAVGYGSERFASFWPADYHVIGKDILVPPHAVYWPIMLKAMEVELPRKLLVHGWWQIKGEKMSKSTGTTVSASDMVDKYGVDAFRFFLIREMTVGKDSDFTEALLHARYQSELCNDLGNLLSRLSNMVHRYCEGILPALVLDEDPEKELIQLASTTLADARKRYDDLQLNVALESIFNFIKGINRYAELRAPWKLAKSTDPADHDALLSSLAVMAEALRIASVLLLPVMPEKCAAILRTLNLDPDAIKWDAETLSWGASLAGAPVGEKMILFPRVELENDAES